MGCAQASRNIRSDRAEKGILAGGLFNSLLDGVPIRLHFIVPDLDQTKPLRWG